MAKIILKTGERTVPEKFESRSEYLIYLRHLFVYEFAMNVIKENFFVLEVGCGEGYGTNLLSKKTTSIVGLDVDIETIERASKKYKAENCVFKIYDGIIIPYNDNTFDVVVSFQVIEHIQNDLNYIAEIYRVLKKRGVFILTTPNKIHRLKPNQKPWNRFHVREYYLNELETILKNQFKNNVKIMGIYGNKEVQEVEVKRVKQVLKLVFLDPFNLRGLIPESLKVVIIKIIKQIINKTKKSEEKEDFFKKYSTKDFYIEKNDINNSLDLLGICKK